MKRLVAILAVCLCSVTFYAQNNCTLSSFSYDVKVDSNLFYISFSQPFDLDENYLVFLNQELLEGDSLLYGPFKAECEIFYSLIVMHKESEECSVQANIGAICSDNSKCRIGDLEISYPECNVNNPTYIDLNFKYENVSDSFSVKGNGENYGTFAYADLPVQVGPFESNCEKSKELVVKDYQIAGCSSTRDGIIICCPRECDAPRFEIAEMECSDSKVYMKLKMSETFEQTNILVKINDTFIQEYEIDLPYITLSANMPFDTLLHTVSVCSVGIADVCCYSQEFSRSDCSAISECKIYDVSYQIPYCEQNEEVYLELDFSYKRSITDSFQVEANGIGFGEHAYADLPVKIGPFRADCDVFYDLAIFDSQDSDCAAMIDSISFCCNSVCLEPIFEVISQECKDQRVKIKVQLFHDLAFDSLNILLNNQPVLSYDLQFPYLYINGEKASLPAYELTICSPTLDNFECCYTQRLQIICNDTLDCVIGELLVRPADCIDTGLPGFYIDFEYANIGSKGFSLKGNGNDYGDFKYESLPIFINTIDSCNIFYEFVVIDNELQCSNFIEYGQFCCTDNCSFKLYDERIKCEDGILTEIGFYLEEETDPIKNYLVYIDSKLVGETNNNNNFLEFAAEIILDSKEVVELTVCDDECCVTKAVNVSECLDVIEECAISSVTTKDVECSDRGLNFILDFDHQGTKNEEFDVFSVFGKFGTYKYSDLPLKIAGYPFVNIGINILFICDKGSLCCQAHLFTSPFCVNSIGKQIKSANVAKKEYRFIRQNPVTMEVILDSPYSKTQYQILDSSGKLVKSFTSDQLETRSDVSDMKSGMYIVRIQYKDEIKLEKLIITN